ncbi:hypothetical protein [Holdemania massiliensis]|uniref:hypothetical protein n=1 Tax=Holdemania massiliensis TaxID=1468449 RepID=UPI001F05FE16|nr:hypothetical protein [Holdemania massiliensis]MCH1941569.1 hypothetical protein [Holdemania massiliensis]
MKFKSTAVNTVARDLLQLIGYIPVSQFLEYDHIYGEFATEFAPRMAVGLSFHAGRILGIREERARRAKA